MSVRPAKSPCVLVVDDEEAICVLLKMHLEGLGFRVELAQNGESALEVLQEFNIDLVITDQDMPGMKGTDLFKRACLAQPYLQDRFLFISGNLAYAQAGFPGRMIQKPFSLDLLGNAVHELIAGKTIPANV